MDKLKQFDKVIRKEIVAEDMLGAGCIDGCNCQSLNIKKKE